jgi:hypothetical protein
MTMPHTFTFSSLMLLLLLSITGHAGNNTPAETGVTAFLSTAQAVIDHAGKTAYTDFLTQVSPKGLVLVRYHSAGTHSTSFVNTFAHHKIPADLDFSRGIKGARPFTIPQILEPLNTAAPTQTATCKTSHSSSAEFDLIRFLNEPTEGSKAAQLTQHFYTLFSTHADTKNDFAKICLLSKSGNQAYYGIISATEDNGNPLISGALFIFEKEQHMWKLRAIAEFL